jgi:D-sedoheptulose 7-phosphate isomerase
MRPSTRSLTAVFDDAIALMRQTVETNIADQAERAIEAICKALREGLPLLVCGNGGSASDAMHITGELVGRFLVERKALNCICLSSNPAVLTAWSNDYSFQTVFSRQIEAYGRAGGVLLSLSTSGNSANVIEAIKVAKALGMTTVTLTGAGGGASAAVTDILLEAPSGKTPDIQQIHICLYHYICEQVEARLT